MKDALLPEAMILLEAITAARGRQGAAQGEMMTLAIAAALDEKGAKIQKREHARLRGG